MDILTGSGEVLTVTGADEDPHRDLFYGFPNSYGSLGYALRIRIQLEPALPYVHLRHVPFATATQLAEASPASPRHGHSKDTAWTSSMAQCSATMSTT